MHHRRRGESKQCRPL